MYKTGINHATDRDRRRQRNGCRAGGFSAGEARGEVLGKETVAVLGYGVQGRGQSLNMKDNGVKVIVGQREKTRSWDLAVQDGWVPGKTLFAIEEAARRGTVVQYLAFRRRAKGILAEAQAAPDPRQGALLLPRLRHRLQRSDRRHAAAGHRRDPRGAEGLGHDRAAAFP